MCSFRFLVVSQADDSSAHHFFLYEDFEGSNALNVIHCTRPIIASGITSVSHGRDLEQVFADYDVVDHYDWRPDADSASPRRHKQWIFKAR